MIMEKVSVTDLVKVIDRIVLIQLKLMIEYWEILIMITLIKINEFQENSHLIIVMNGAVFVTYDLNVLSHRRYRIVIDYHHGNRQPMDNNK